MAKPFQSRWPAATAATLAAAFGLRAVLAVRGGQGFWFDEQRFNLARVASDQVAAGHWRDLAAGILASPGHLLFQVVAVVPALFELWFRSGQWLPALFFAGASTAMLWAIGAAAVAGGGGEVERFFVVAAATLTTSLFYYARHFFPYDLALFFFLRALALALTAERTVGSSLRVGLWTAGGFLLYNGYWNLAVAVGGFYLVNAATRRGFRSSCLGFGLGAALPLVALYAAGRAFGLDLIQTHRDLAVTTVQGDYDQAWRFVGEYFWHAEGVIALLWLGGLVWAGAEIRRSARESAALTPVLFLFVLYALIVLCSDVLLRITVAARHVRELAPFCCWLTGLGLADAWRRGGWRRGAAGAGLGLMALAAAANFAAPLAQVFPRDFPAAARRTILARQQRGGGLQPLALINDWYFDHPGLVGATPAGMFTYWSLPHPYQFVPYLFEGYSEATRARFAAADRSMKVLGYAGVTPLPDPPGGFRLTFRNRAAADDEAEPLLASGAWRRGDVVFIRYRAGARAQVGWDHWGSSPVVSAPFAWARDREHTLVVIAPCLAGPAEPESWRHRLYLACDGRPVLAAPADFFPSDPGSAVVGLNLIRATSAADSLAMDQVQFGPLSAGDWAGADRAFADGPRAR